MLDWHLYQICYPLEIKILLLLWYSASASESPSDPQVLLSQMSLVAHVRPAKTQINLGIRPV